MGTGEKAPGQAGLREGSGSRKKGASGRGRANAAGTVPGTPERIDGSCAFFVGEGRAGGGVLGDCEGAEKLIIWNISTCAVADPTAHRCCNKLHAVKPPDYNHTGGFIDDLPNIDKRIRPEKPEALIRCFWQNTPCIESSIA